MTGIWQPGGLAFGSGVLPTIVRQARTPEEIRAQRLEEYKMLRKRLHELERNLIEDGILDEQREETDEFELRGSL